MTCRDVTFLNDCVGPEVEAACANPATGEVKHASLTNRHTRMVFIKVYSYVVLTGAILCIDRRKCEGEAIINACI